MASLINRVIQRRLSAATLLEVVVGLVIISLVFGIVVTLYLQLMGSTLSMKKYKAIQVLQQESIRIKYERRWENEKYSVEQFTITKTIEDCPLCQGIKVLLLEATDQQGKTVAVRKELVYL